MSTLDSFDITLLRLSLSLSGKIESLSLREEIGTRSRICSSRRIFLMEYSAKRDRLRDGISWRLSQWNGLQMAVQNQWGGRDSHQKSLQLAADIFSWFSQAAPKAPPSVEDLENLLHESMLLSFNTEIEDGSIEQIAEELMMMHEDFQQGNR